MKKSQKNWKYLLLRYLMGDLTPEEEEEMKQQMASGPEKQAEFDKLKDDQLWEQSLEISGRIDQQAAFKRLQTACPGLSTDDQWREDPAQQPVEQARWWNLREWWSAHRWWHAAWRVVAVLVAIAGVWWWFSRDPAAGLVSTVRLAGRAAINLDGMADGEIASFEGAALYKHGNELRWLFKDRPGRLWKASLQTGIGQQYVLILEDGTRAQVNGASHIVFPAMFQAAKREVEVVEGEVYFEVQKNKARPFWVDAGEMHIEVTGTRFNVSAYEQQEDKRVTLLEGEVKIGEGKEKVILKPGEQAVINKRHPTKVRMLKKPEAVIAWTEGRFDFTGQDIKSALVAIASRYGKEIFFQGNFGEELSSGYFSTSDSLKNILQTLGDANQFKFTIQDNRIMVNGYYK